MSWCSGSRQRGTELPACRWGIEGLRSQGRAVCACVHACVHLCVHQEECAFESLCVCGSTVHTYMSVCVWVAQGEGPSCSKWAGYVKEQPELPRASYQLPAECGPAAGAEVAAGTSVTAVPALVPFFPWPPRLAATGHGVDAGALSAETRQRVSSSPDMARLGSAGRDTLAGGEVGGGSGASGPPGALELGWEGLHPRAGPQGMLWGAGWMGSRNGLG